MKKIKFLNGIGSMFAFAVVALQQNQQKLPLM